MTTKQKLKSIIIDNILVLIISLAACLGGALLLSNQILPSLRVLWFLMFFIGFGVFMFNLCMILKIGDYTRFMDHVKKDIDDISDGKIDGKKNGKPL